MPPQIIPGIDSAGVPIVPLKADRVVAHRAGRFWPRRSLIHRQQSCRLPLRYPGLTPIRIALLMAGRAGTSQPQPRKVPVARVPIFPVDFQALSGGLLDAHLRWRHHVARQLRRRLPPRLFRVNQTNPFVTHKPSAVVGGLTAGRFTADRPIPGRFLAALTPTAKTPPTAGSLLRTASGTGYSCRPPNRPAAPYTTAPSQIARGPARPHSLAPRLSAGAPASAPDTHPIDRNAGTTNYESVFPIFRRKIRALPWA